LQPGQTVTVYGTPLDQSGNPTSGCPDRITNVTNVTVGGAAPPTAPPSGVTGTRAHVPTGVESITLSGFNPSRIASSVDYVFAAQQGDADRWRAAGVKAIGYIDIGVQYDPPDFAPLRTGDESTYLHTCGGARARFTYGALGASFMDEGSPSYQSLVHNLVAGMAPHYDGFFLDDPLADAMEYAPNLSPPCDTWVNFSYHNPATLASSKLASLLGNAFGGTSTYLNGLGFAPDDGTAWSVIQNALNDPSVAGGAYEFCFLGQTDHQLDNKRTDEGWTSTMASYVDTSNRGKAFWCFSFGNNDGSSDAGRDQRLYAYASYLLGYDGRAIFQEKFGESNGMPVYPETTFVPSSPIDPVGSNPRRFGSCAINNAAIGACAAFVNPSATHGASVPSGYGAALQLVGGSILEGGSLASTSAPGSIGPAEAVILVQSGRIPTANLRQASSVRTHAPIDVPLPTGMPHLRTRS